MPFLIGAGFCLLALVAMTSLDRLFKINGYNQQENIDQDDE